MSSKKARSLRGLGYVGLVEIACSVNPLQTAKEALHSVADLYPKHGGKIFGLNGSRYFQRSIRSQFLPEKKKGFDLLLLFPSI